MAVHATRKVRESTGNPAPLPLLIKIAPDLKNEEKKEIAEVVMQTKVTSLSMSKFGQALRDRQSVESSTIHL